MIATDVTQAPNDKGYFSEGNVSPGHRLQTPEPVFGSIKSVLGFRQCLLRGLDNVRGEWNLVTMAWNMKRMFVLAGTI